MYVYIFSHSPSYTLKMKLWKNTTMRFFLPKLLVKCMSQVMFEYCEKSLHATSKKVLFRHFMYGNIVQNNYVKNITYNYFNCIFLFFFITKKIAK